MDTKILNSVNPADIGAMCVPNLIGNVANWPVLADFAHAHGLVTIEDSADTIGYLTDGKIDNFADVSTTSFYASHVVTGAGFGGAVAFKNEQAFNRAKSFIVGEEDLPNMEKQKTLIVDFLARWME